MAALQAEMALEMPVHLESAGSAIWGVCQSVDRAFCGPCAVHPLMVHAPQRKSEGQS